jgi:hypothetical protein
MMAAYADSGKELPQTDGDALGGWRGRGTRGAGE